MQVCHMTQHGKYVTMVTVLALLVVGGAFLMTSYWRGRGARGVRQVTGSVWVWRDPKGGDLLTPVVAAVEQIPERQFDPSQSPYIITKEEDRSETTYTHFNSSFNTHLLKSTYIARSAGSTKDKLIATYDPAGYVEGMLKTDFSLCEYSQCRMTRDVEAADAVIFMVARLTRILYKNKDGITKVKETPLPKFRRRPEQVWVMRTDEAPSRFSWFSSMDRPGLREMFNWTMTHKLDSDIINAYGYLVPRDVLPVKDYDQIFKGKTRSAAWFVSHCPVRSNRKGYITRMMNRTDVDVFGMCGDHKCGTAPKGSGIWQLRKKADKEECMPMLTQHYKYYLAFENSLCQEYVTEKFFKLFNDADVIPVVRGGSNYKLYFPPKSYIDASDFSTPEALADFLEDLGRDKGRYIQYLQAKDRYRSVKDFPEWQCKLCKKLHKNYEGAKITKANAYKWWTDNSCHDDVVDSTHFM